MRRTVRRTGRRYPERVAWAVLLLSFLTFCALSISIPYTIRWYIINATRPHDATLEVIEGTVLIGEPRLGTSVGRNRDMGPVKIAEGSSVRTDANSRAFITFFDNSTASLANGTAVVLEQMRSPRFGLSPRPNRLILEVEGGSVSLGAALPVGRSLHFQVRSPHMMATLEDGSYLLEVTNQATELVVYQGNATVTASGVTKTLARQERTRVELDQLPSGPEPAARDLVVNGEFTEPLDGTWRVYNDQGGDGGDVDGEANVEASGDRMALRFYRTGSGGNSDAVIVEQDIGKDIPDLASSLRLEAEVKVLFQSLAGGGMQSSEYPVIFRLNYKDRFGSEAHWYVGFYYQSGNHTMNGIPIPRGPWVRYESQNLLDSLTPRPFHITSLQVYASGWDYESYVSRVRLTIE